LYRRASGVLSSFPRKKEPRAEVRDQQRLGSRLRGNDDSSQRPGLVLAQLPQFRIGE
jgi:hypothetical protein